MHVAFHFDESITEDSNLIGTPLRNIERATLEALLTAVPVYRQHLRIRSGIPGIRSIGGQDPEEVARKILADAAAWRTIDNSEEYATWLTTRPLTVEVIEGIAPEDAVHVNGLLELREDYLGAVQVRVDQSAHWSFFFALVPLRYRVHRGVVSLYHALYEDPDISGQDDRDHQWREDLEAYLKPRGALHVNFASSGVEDTVFDPRYSREYATRVGRVDRVLGTLLSGVADEIYLRSRPLDPGLIDVLDAALQALEKHNSSEQLAHVALSCRRLIERLADVLYPPRAEPVDGRQVTKSKYINRLCAYVTDNLPSSGESAVLLASVEDVGKRISAIHDASNKGVHGNVAAAGLHRLVLNIALLTRDLLALNEIDMAASHMYEQEQLEAVATVIGKISSDDS